MYEITCIFQLFMYEITGEQKYRNLVDAFLDRYRGDNVPEKVTQTPQGLAWRDNWGVLRYAGMRLLSLLNRYHFLLTKKVADTQLAFLVGCAVTDRV